MTIEPAISPEFPATAPKYLRRPTISRPEMVLAGWPVAVGPVV